jgi:riboflavin kinase/FMN adenylyltransferase
VLTFDRHPATIVRPESAPRLLTTVETKLALLRATGVDEVVVLRFDAERAAESAEDFVQTVLVDALGARVVVVGTSFRFGHGQGGDVALLEQMGRDLGFVVERVDLVADDHGGAGVVSSSRIRRLVAAGVLADATELLGRPHAVQATLVARDPAEAGRPLAAARLRARVDPALLVPPAGTYLGEVAPVVEGVPVASRRRPAEIVVARAPRSDGADAGAVDGAGPAVGPAVDPPELELHLASSGGPDDPARPGDEVAVSFLAPLGR